MNNRSIQVALLILLAIPSMCAQGQQVMCEATDPASFDSCLERKAVALIEEGFPSFSFGVIRGDSLVYIRSFGVSDKQSGTLASPRTVYQIGSVTKMFTGLLFARLIVEGEMKLGDPISMYLPENVTVPTDSTGAIMTLQHLANHTSGLPRYPPNLDRIDGDPMVGFDLDPLWEGVSTAELVHPIGTDWSYSNFGYGLLGTIMQQAMGESLGALLSRFVLHGEALNRITFTPDFVHEQRLATPYRDEAPHMATSPWDMGTLAGAGALYASVEELSAFASLLMMPEIEQDPELREAVRLMQTPFHRFRSQNMTSWGYGIGSFIVDNWQGSGHTAVWHGGDLDGYAASLLVAPSAGIGVVFLTNSSNGQALSRSRLNNWLLPAAIKSFSSASAYSPEASCGADC